MQVIYNRVIGLAMRRKPIALAVGVLAVIGGALTLQHIPQRFFPFAERDQFVVDVWLPEGWKVEATDSAVRRIEAVLRHEKEVVNYTSFVGSSAPRFYYNVNPQLPDKNYAQLLVATTSAEATPRLVESLRPKLALAAPEARVFLANFSRARSRKRQSKSGSRAKTTESSSAWAIRWRTFSRALPAHWMFTAIGARMRIASRSIVRQEVANRLGFTNAGIGQELAGGSMVRRSQPTGRVIAM